MKFKTIVIWALLFCSPWVGASEQDRYTRMGVDDLRQQASELHPSALYILAGKLFSDGEKDEAIFWLYVGQIRYRFLLGANPDLDPSGEPAVFSALQNTVGRRINEYAGGDPDTWVTMIRKARRWDLDNPNKITSKQEHHILHQEILDGLEKMTSHIENNKESIKRERAKRGLENR